MNAHGGVCCDRPEDAPLFLETPSEESGSSLHSPGATNLHYLLEDELMGPYLGNLSV